LTAENAESAEKVGSWANGKARSNAVSSAVVDPDGAVLGVLGDLGGASVRRK
jgi:hypothetical protein